MKKKSSNLTTFALCASLLSGVVHASECDPGKLCNNGIKQEKRAVPL